MLADRDQHTRSLIQQAQRGDARAFEELYNQYSALVLRTAYLLLGEYVHTEDVTQEVFVEVYRHLDQYQSERGAFATWIYRITVNKCTRVQQRWRFWQRGSSLNDHGDYPSPILSPLEVALIGDQQRRVWLAVQQLSLKLRTVVILRYYHNLPYAEIAQIVQCPIGTVRSRLNAAHTHLQRNLEEYVDAKS